VKFDRDVALINVIFCLDECHLFRLFLRDNITISYKELQNMTELLTTKQLQDLLGVDRVTVYRMLNDGRLRGVKIGNQWRFPKSELNRLLGEAEEQNEPLAQTEPLEYLPSDCWQRVQEIFAGIIGIGALTISSSGEPLTQPTFANPFCELMLSSAEGRVACQESWKRIALSAGRGRPFQLCHAGLCYQRVPVHSEGRAIGWLIAGQFYIQNQDWARQEERLSQLSQKYHLPLSVLLQAAARIPVLKKYQQQQVQEWTPKVAETFESILCERSDLMSRLRRIAELSAVRPF